MAVDSSTMNQIAINVFAEMFGLETSVEGNEPIPEGSECYVASILISGASEERLIVEAPIASANLIAETMFDADAGTLHQDEVRDAIGEVINMIGGNVKVTYDDASQLSIPEVTSADCKQSSFGNWINVTVNRLPLTVRWHDVEAESPVTAC